MLLGLSLTTLNSSNKRSKHGRIDALQQTSTNRFRRSGTLRLRLSLVSPNTVDLPIVRLPAVGLIAGVPCEGANGSGIGDGRQSRNQEAGVGRNGWGNGGQGGRFGYWDCLGEYQSSFSLRRRVWDEDLRR